MICKIQAEGFQSIKQPIELEISGLTTLWGESNIGKSALIRFLRAAFSNRQGTGFITVGEALARLSWENCRGHLIWEKNGSSSTYIINGKTIKKPGRGVIPEELLALGIQEIVTTDKRKYWPQIQFQGEPPFILADRSPTNTAELLGANPEIIQINRALKLSSVDLNQKNILISVLEDQLSEVNQRLQIMESCEQEFNQDKLILEQIQAEQDQIQGEISQFQELLTSYEQLENQVLILESASQVLIPEPVDYRDLLQLENLSDRYEKVDLFLSLGNLDFNGISSLDQERIQVRDLALVFRRSLALARKMRILEPSRTVPVPDRWEAQGLVNSLEKLACLEIDYRRNQQILESCKRKQVSLEDYLRSLDREQQELQRDLVDFQECPFCTAPIRDGKYCGKDRENSS